MFAADAPIFLLKSLFLCIWIDSIPEKKPGNLLRLTVCAFFNEVGRKVLDCTS